MQRTASHNGNGHRPKVLNRSDPPPERLRGASRMIEFREVAEGIDFMDSMTDLHSDVTGCEVGGLACWLMNHGNTMERTEALFALIPIARRAYGRLYTRVKGGAS